MIPPLMLGYRAARSERAAPPASVSYTLLPAQKQRHAHLYSTISRNCMPIPPKECA